MKKLALVFTIAIVLTFGVTAFGDSPLSSTDFYRAYHDIEMVRYAVETESMDRKIADYLKNYSVETEYKLAVINALYCSAENMSHRRGNADRYLTIMYDLTLEDIGRDLSIFASKARYVHDYNIEFLYEGKFNGPDSIWIYNDEIVILAYLMAMDGITESYNEKLTFTPLDMADFIFNDHFNISYHSFTTHIVAALIKAQYGNTHRVDSVQTNPPWKYVRDVMYSTGDSRTVTSTVAPYSTLDIPSTMRPAAGTIIWEYMRLYAENSEESKVNPFAKDAKYEIIGYDIDGSRLHLRTIYFSYYEDYYKYGGQEVSAITKGEFEKLVYGDSSSNTDEYKELIDKVNKEWEETDEKPKWSMTEEQKVERVRELMRDHPEIIESALEHGDQWLRDTVESIRAEEAEKEAKNNSKFKDTDNHWAKDSIEEVSELGIMTGKGDDKFDPNAPVTRGELAVIILRLIEVIRQLISQLLS